MKIIKRFFIILIFISCFFVFGRYLPPEITYIPAWVEDLEITDISTKNFDKAPIFFRLNGKLGYLYNNGEITYMEDFLHGTAVDNNGFISYSRQNEVLVIRDINGKSLNIINFEGYPFFSGDRRFIISYDNNRVSEINDVGEILWQKTFSSSITEIFAVPSLVFIGTVGGKFTLIDLLGTVVFSHTTKTSRINVVYGGAVSRNGDHLLTVSGIDPQIILFWNREGDGYSVNGLWEIDKTLRRHAVTGFSNDGLFAFVEAEDELLVLDLKHKKIKSIQITGRLQGIDFSGSSELVHAVGKDDSGLYLMVADIDGDMLFFTRLPGSDIMFKRDQKRIILGIDSKLFGFNIVSM